MMEKKHVTSKKRALAGIVIIIGLLVGALLYFGQVAPEITTASHSHGHHGGHYMRLLSGSGYDLELTINQTRRCITIYATESETHSPYPLPYTSLQARFTTLDQVFECVFLADPRTSDPEGRSSRFALSLDNLPQQFIAANQYELRTFSDDGGNTLEAILSHDNNHTHDYHHD